MVILHVKRGDESQFLLDTKVSNCVDDVLSEITYIYNGRLKISRICYELEDLGEHGTQLPEEMMGLTDEQVEELKLKDEWAELCVPSGGALFNKDPVGRRNGRRPNDAMQQVIKKSVDQVREAINKKKTERGECLTKKDLVDAMDVLRGTVMIIYPMNLPTHDNVRRELENREDLEGTQASKEVIDLASAQLWFSGKELLRGKLLSEYLGNNDKTKIIVKLSKSGHGPPAREPVFTEEEKKRMMADAYRRQEQLKKLEQDDDDQYHNSAWADSGRLRRQFHGLGDISWRPK